MSIVQNLRDLAQMTYHTNKELDDLIAERDRYKKALEFYADRDSYTGWTKVQAAGGWDYTVNKIHADSGTIAREALKS